MPPKKSPAARILKTVRAHQSLTGKSDADMEELLAEQLKNASLTRAEYDQFLAKRKGNNPQHQKDAVPQGEKPVLPTSGLPEDVLRAAGNADSAFMKALNAVMDDPVMDDPVALEGPKEGGQAIAKPAAKCVLEECSNLHKDLVAVLAKLPAEGTVVAAEGFKEAKEAVVKGVDELRKEVEMLRAAVAAKAAATSNLKKQQKRWDQIKDTIVSIGVMQKTLQDQEKVLRQHNCKPELLKVTEDLKRAEDTLAAAKVNLPLIQTECKMAKEEVGKFKDSEDISRCKVATGKAAVTHATVYLKRIQPAKPGPCTYHFNTIAEAVRAALKEKVLQATAVPDWAKGHGSALFASLLRAHDRQVQDDQVDLRTLENLTPKEFYNMVVDFCEKRNTNEDLKLFCEINGVEIEPKTGVNTMLTLVKRAIDYLGMGKKVLNSKPTRFSSISDKAGEDGAGSEDDRADEDRPVLTEEDKQKAREENAKAAQKAREEYNAKLQALRKEANDQKMVNKAAASLCIVISDDEEEGVPKKPKKVLAYPQGKHTVFGSDTEEEAEDEEDVGVSSSSSHIPLPAAEVQPKKVPAKVPAKASEKRHKKQEGGAATKRRRVRAISDGDSSEDST